LTKFSITVLRNATHQLRSDVKT